jgi:hypothetical protein
MASFNWEIDDASGVTTPVCHCGEVILRNAKNPSGQRWDIEEPDENSLVESVTGGTVGKLTASEIPETDNLLKSIGSLNLSKKFIQAIIFIVVFALSAGFLMVVYNGVKKETLDFQTFMSGVTYFLACLGLVRYAKK